MSQQAPPAAHGSQSQVPCVPGSSEPWAMPVLWVCFLTRLSSQEGRLCSSTVSSVRPVGQQRPWASSQHSQGRTCSEADRENVWLEESPGWVRNTNTNEGVSGKEGMFTYVSEPLP